jgi:uncharacterized protein YcgL (UPF0745 family)
MGVWGLDIFDDDLAVDIKEEFESYLQEGMDESEAIEGVLDNNDNLLEDPQDMGTFILTIASLAAENNVTNRKIKKLLKSLEKNNGYWLNLKDESQDLYEARRDLLRELT